MSDLTTDERLALIERLEQQEATRRRAAIRAAWASVAGATLVFALVVLGGWWSIRLEREELATIDAERQELQERVEVLRREATAVEAQLKSTEAARAAALGALGRVPEKEREAAVSANPDVAKLIPRAYLQVVEEADRGFANEIGRRLQAGGVVAAGVEYVPSAKGLKRNEVRYYKDREIDGAKRIVALLAQAGVDAVLQDLNMETNTKVRPYHFEVWFAAGARNSASAASRPADTRQATQPERTAHVEVVILTHNGSADQAVHTVVMSPLPSGSGPDRSYAVTGGRLLAEVAPGRYSVTVKDEGWLLRSSLVGPMRVELWCFDLRSTSMRWSDSAIFQSCPSCLGTFVTRARRSTQT